MKPIAERKRPKATGKGAKPLHLGIEHWIIDSAEFKALKGSPIKMLIALGRQYKGYNNGNLKLSLARSHWRSDDTSTNAIKFLLESGWIVKTKHGGLGIGSDMFAITWWPIDECKEPHDYPTEHAPSHAWMKTRRPPRKPELVVPETGTALAPNCSKNEQQAPETGTENGVFQAA